MKPIKKVEIIIETLQLPHVFELLERIGVQNYTIIQDVLGKGLHGDYDGQELTDVLTNSLLIIACKQKTVNQIVKVIEPVLEESGGVILVSDAQWVKY